MPHAHPSTTPVEMDNDLAEGRYAQLGDYTISFETFKTDFDTAPYFRGLPGDRCSCEHLGYVVSGRIDFRWPDREESYRAGDAYVAPPGHLTVVTAGTQTVEFTRTADLEPVMAVVGRNVAAEFAGSGSAS